MQVSAFVAIVFFLFFSNKLGRGAWVVVVARLQQTSKYDVLCSVEQK